MGRKGVSKRKPKKSGKNSTEGNKGSPVQNLVKDKSAPSSQDSSNPWTGTNKSQKKR